MSDEPVRSSETGETAAENQRHVERAQAQARQAQASRRSFLTAGSVALGFGAIEYQHDTNGSPVRSVPERTMQTRQTEEITLDVAKQLIDAAEEEASEIGVPSVITVVNSEGNLVAQRRMDDAWLPSVNISRQKAYTAAGLEMATHNLAQPSQPGNSLYGLQNTDQGRLVVFGGGYPLQRGETVVGAIASSGGQVEQDRQVAEAGVARFDELLD